MNEAIEEMAQQAEKLSKARNNRKGDASSKFTREADDAHAVLQRLDVTSANSISFD